MITVNESVPFDPGFSPISFSFFENITAASHDFSAIKVHHQKKFWLSRCESTIVEFIKKSSAFYLGCMLWGGYIHYCFEAAQIDGNGTKGLSEEEISNLDCASEPKAILQYINDFNRDCNYFLKRPAKIPAEISEILNAYVEFAKINNNFVGVNNTKDVKVPKQIEHFENLSKEDLDKLGEKIHAAISSGKIEKLLELGFYNP